MAVMQAVSVSPSAWTVRGRCGAQEQRKAKSGGCGKQGLLEGI